ncbi:sensor histidine kinase [Planomonospora sp. ID67723]|uniref:sensor histidine kinase n=1 Tax=Planomonospora sp. ID67723 TaxID=2738134 RepID=UPI0018C429F3|nr:sensor histidine kinase [Planomonospora sp. ID67723]MBG0830295.1 sensor histidine kinase [Planomonospora sp. ID67723]
MRSVPWVSPVLYGTVLAAGLYAGLAGLGTTHMTQFVGGIAALFALDLVERLHPPTGTASWPAVVSLCARVALFVVVAAADGSGLSRVLFVLVPFTAYFSFGRTVAVALAAACGGLVVAGYELGTPRWYTDLEQVSDLLMFFVGLVLTVAMAATAVEERRGRTRLEASHRRLAAYSAQVAELSAAAERNRVARDIHDDLGHHLTAVVVLLEKATAFRDLDPGQAQRAIEDAHRSARRALDDVRHSVRTLRADPAPFRLSSALAGLVDDQADDGRVAVTLEFSGDEDGYDAQTLTALYRAAQEGITNARRHANATRVSVAVAFDESGARLTVADDGTGLPPGREGFGLLGMRERAELAGGRVEIDSGPGTGTCLTVTVPRGDRARSMPSAPRGKADHDG